MRFDNDELERVDKTSGLPEYLEAEKTSIKKRSYNKREEDFLRMNHLTRFGGSEEGYVPAILGRRKRNKMSILKYLSQLKDLSNDLKVDEAILNRLNSLNAA